MFIFKLNEHTNYMKSKKYILITFIFSLCIIGLLSIYSASFLVNKSLITKQITWISIGIIISIILYFIGIDKLFKYSFLLYMIGIFLLIYVLLFGKTLNGTKAWINIFGFSLQPSEFMKIPLILLLSNIIEEYNFKENKNFKTELKVILKIIFYTLIPSILVFIEPDTGAVINYLLIAFTILFMSKIRKIWWILLFTFLISFTSIFFISYLYIPKTFIKIFGNNFYYRIHRLLDWSSSIGMQLENSLIAIGTGGLFGMGLKNTPIYIPEAYSDFIFSIIANNFGLIKTILILILIFSFDLFLIYLIKKEKRIRNKYAITCILISLLFSQIISIGMTLGLVPIMGIPLPYLSYGGSNIIVNLIFISIIIKKDVSHTQLNII